MPNGTILIDLIRSLPSRERGLKLLAKKAKLLQKVSLPSRERGLKSFEVLEIFALICRSLRGSVD